MRPRVAGSLSIMIDGSTTAFSHIRTSATVHARCSRPARAVRLGAALALLAACGEGELPEVDCSVEARKAFVADLMTDYYLWYDQVPEVDIAAAESPEELMSQMMFPGLDRWSGMQQQAARQQYFDQGRYQGLGYTIVPDPSGGLRVSWVHEGSAAGRAGLDRGALLVTINGRSVAELGSAELGVELGAPVVTHHVVELDGSERDVELEQGDVDITSVKSATVLETPSGPVGYFMLTTFVRPGEDELRAAFRDFQAAGVERLVVDVRYNGGGLLSTAALLGSLINSGAAGQPLIIETYNDRHTELNRRRLLFAQDEALDATEVVFLTSGRTASASEQVINGLAPYLDRVALVGTRTLGKPVGADSWDHCGYSITPITFHSLNANGEGDYFDGIQPDCSAEDDLFHRLGDPEERLLGAALRIFERQPCEAASAELEDKSTASRALPELPPGPVPELIGTY